jgi:hypothetical protein
MQRGDFPVRYVSLPEATQLRGPLAVEVSRGCEGLGKPMVLAACRRRVAPWWNVWREECGPWAMIKILGQPIGWVG